MDQKKLYQWIEEKSPLICDLADRIWEYAELSLQEYRSTEAYLEVLRQEGFTVKEHLAGIDTAFSGSFGEGHPVIGILGEYDALSSLSQKAGSLCREEVVEGGNGHGCGHNLLGAGALAAALAIKQAIAAGELRGTVVFYGCPGEEGCAGKTFMARAGLFRDLDAALTWHPGDTNEVTTGSNAACLQYAYTFTGVSAHAAGDPYHGRSGLDAAELMNVGIQFLREHIRPGESIHYSFLDVGGSSPNVVQPRATVLYMVRSDNVANAKKLLKRVHQNAQGAALMTQTQVSWQQIDGTASTLSNTVLERLLQTHLEQAPMPSYTAQELDYGKALANTYPREGLPGSVTLLDASVRHQVDALSEGGQKAINDFVMPYVPSSRMEPGSTDVGDVSWLTPTAQFTAATWTSQAPGHSWQNVSIGKTSIGHKGMLYGAKVLAGAVATLMEQPRILEEARAEFQITAKAGYNCPLEPDTMPKPAV